MQTHPQTQTPTPTQQKIRLAIIYAFYLMVGLNSGGFGIILPDFAQTYGLDKSATGLLFLAVTGGYLTAALSGNWFTTTYGLHKFLTAGLLLSAAGSLTLWLIPPLAIALLARLTLGLAGATLETGGNFYLAHLPRNTALLNYLHAFFGAGALLGPLVATWVLENHWGWNNLFLIWLTFTLLIGLAYRLAFGRDNLQTPQPTTAAPTTTSPTLTALRHPTILLATLYLLIYVGVETTVGSWTYTYLTESQNQPTPLAGALVSLYWTGLTLGRIILGWLTERHNLDRPLLLTCNLTSLLATALVWLATNNTLLAAIGLFLIGFTYGPLYPTTLAILTRHLPTHLITGAIGVITGLSILGVAIFPWLAGNLLQTNGLTTLYPYIIALTILMNLLGLLLPRPTRAK